MKTLIISILAACPLLAYAAPECNGNYLQGTITQAPYFAAGMFQSGVELSHTHISVTSGGLAYDVAIDNVFANDYDQTGGNSVPASYQSSLQVGQTVELCGENYTGGDQGIHWVHTNCGVDSSGPAGYMIVADQNLTSNQEYCKLWSN